MRPSRSLPIGIAIVILAFCVTLLAHLDSQSANMLLGNIRKIQPHATQDELNRLLGPPTYTFEAPSFPSWLQASAVGRVTEGTVLVFTVNHYHPALLIIHILPTSGVQFVTWEPT